jgi:hypothetical protein
VQADKVTSAKVKLSRHRASDARLGRTHEARSRDLLEDEATELGIGLYASIWRGFLQGGVGYNLNAP